VEEEKNADGIVRKLKMVKDSPQGLLVMDQELGQRGPAPAVPSEGAGG
jgi:ferritin